MAIKTKYYTPSINEFSPNDIVINVNEGALFFKSHNKLYRLSGDDIGTPDTQEAGIFYIGMDTNPPGSAEGTYTSWGANSPSINPLTAPSYAVNNNIKADIHLGAQQSNTNINPSFPRIAIQPPSHTEGPFNLFARDTKSHAHLDMFYGTDQASNHTSFNAKGNIFTLNHLGQFSIGGKHYMEGVNKQNIGTFSVHQYSTQASQGWGSTSLNNVISQANDNVDKWYLIGLVGFNHGAINIRGYLGGHTQGDATVDITYTLRDAADGLYGGSVGTSSYPYGSATGSYNPASQYFPDQIRQTGMVTGEVGTGADIEVFNEYSGSQYNPGGPKKDAVELVTNGNFDEDSSWTQEATGWDIGSGVATFSGADYKWFGQGPLETTHGKFYLIKFTVTTTTPGEPLVVYLGGNTTAAAIPNTSLQNEHIYHDGDVEVILECGTSNNALRFYPGYLNNRWQGTIDNVSVKEANLESANRKWIYLRADQYAVCNLDFKSTTGTSLLWDGTYTTTNPTASFHGMVAGEPYSFGPEHVLSQRNINLQLDGIGDACIQLNADRDNNGESGNPWIHFTQDGGLIDTVMGMVGGDNDDPFSQTIKGGLQNSFMIRTSPSDAGGNPSPFHIAVSESVAFTVGRSGGVGIGDYHTGTVSPGGGSVSSTNPAFPLEVWATENWVNADNPSEHYSDGEDAYHIARFHNMYKGTANAGNGIRIQFGSEAADTGTSTSRSFLLFENSAASSYLQGGVYGKGATTRGVNYSTSSDRRLKENIGPTRFSIDDLMKIKVRDFNWVGSETLSNGFIAQELFKIYPEAVSHPEDDLVGDGPLDPEEFWSVDYGTITPLLTQAIQDQQRMIEELQNQIKEIKDELSRK